MRVWVQDSSYPDAVLHDELAAFELDVGPQPAPDTHAILTGPGHELSVDALARLPALRVISSCSVGLDHVPVDVAVARGITVFHVPDYCVEEMADHTIAFVLALLRGIVPLDRRTRQGIWDYLGAGPLRLISGTRLGVLGFGRIGSAVASRGKALGMFVSAHDPHIPDAEIERHGCDAGLLEEVLGRSDVLSLHLPLTASTRGLLGAAELARMPPGSFIVNTSRAQLIDEVALLDALDTGHLAGIATDVFPIEPIADSPLFARDDTVVSPHAAWYSERSETIAYRRAAAATRLALTATVRAGVQPAPAIS